MEIVEHAKCSFQEQLGIIKREISTLPEPEVHELNRRSTLQISAAVAVDAGQSLFRGILREMGIMLLQVASSEDEAPKSYAFGMNPILRDEYKKQQVEIQLNKWMDTDEMVRNFVMEMKWNKITEEGIMPAGCYENIGTLGDFVRELLEWAKLYQIALSIKEIYQRLPNIQPVLLRDGTLRFDHMGEYHTRRLYEIFKSIGIPLIGVSKTSKLLINPLITMWLKVHNVFNMHGAFLVKLPYDRFRELGFRLSRYFGTEEESPRIRFGRYIIGRFDSLPGSKNIFAIDVPHYYFETESSFNDLLIILSGVAEHSTATSYPIPGYPFALKKAHDRVVFTKDKVYLLENTLRRNLPPDIYNMLKILET